MAEMATCMAIEFMESDTDVFLDSGVQCLYTLLREERIKVENFCSQTLPLYSDHQFRRTLRVPRNIFSVLLDVMKEDLKHTPHFGGRHPVQPEDKLAVFLKYIGSTDTLLIIGQLFNLTEYSVIKARREVTEAILNRLLSTTIKWPTPQELNNVTNEFNNITAQNFPGIVGAMDGSHIAIATPLKSPHSYFNRKKFHSVVLQAVCKPDLTFIDVCVGCPGRIHDVNILRRSELWSTGWQKCNFGRYHVIADAAYPCIPWIMTHYRDNGHLTLQQRDYNRELSHRQVIERSFGILKQRFRRLKMGVDIKDIDELNKVILAVCVIHNICLLEDPEQLFDDADNDDRDNPCLQPVPNIIRPSNTNAMGQLKRIRITNNL
ncbi:hypothetical protein ACJMK2_013523 [Sinanodonta woodiana]|uniref:DDE Tnp4 domain-containing protein n=1 Tax=Sinanodonta woodiana TaxID=1069815 RepID=A0ABD3UXR8_SINWO